ncbi:DNA-formamidopyrimidine glycosylase [Pediococcus claussenii]|uniref:DNA-formamidopyrimidine glycosylase n=1 Tax=Pediococcus claussenii TaxID=187452 RepID=UPI00081A62D5|nr:DNA-formamidopyrimidine glycosylase [Pediococcus claussenii]ANZ68933.1 DNA-formamidopyrimidine glycosylase [Pediococcus claussenii]
MPELPEVETVRRGLEALVKGKTIKQVNVRYDKMVSPNPDEFKSALKGKKILDIERRGKYLIFRFSENLSMVSHLKMEGKYAVLPHTEPLSKHDHVIFELTDGSDLRYNDTRKFGRMNLVPSGKELTVGGLATIGPEPTPETLTFEYLSQRLRSKKVGMKSFLLNQSNVAGLGNIYVDEVLWLTKVHPLQPSNTLTDEEIKALRLNIFSELERAINAHGTTVFSYLNAAGHAGSFQNQLNVYHRQGKPCPRCGTLIEKIKVAQRGTHFCPHCQKLRLPND